jgi:hypothetical protein
MNFDMRVTVGLEISGISVDEMGHAVTLWLEISGISKDELRHAVTVGLEISGISVDELRHAGYCVVGDTDIPEISNHTVTRMAKCIYRYT